MTKYKSDFHPRHAPLLSKILKELGAHGTVNQTLQDKLPKEMSLLKICFREDSDAYLPEFIADFNQRFAEELRSSADAHRPLTNKDTLSHILSWQDPCTVLKTPTVQFENVVYQIQTERPI